MSQLSQRQIVEIAKLAREAWEAWAGREQFLEANGELSVTECFNAWRHWQQGEACGRQSLKACTQDDFLRLKAHFLALCGRTEQATHTLTRAANEPQRLARYKLAQALQERGLREEYAAAICRRQFRCELADASPKQLWNLFYTVRNRRPKKEAVA